MPENLGYVRQFDTSAVQPVECFTPRKRSLKVNLIGAYAKAAHGRQLGRLGQYGGVKLGTRPDANKVHISDPGFEFIANQGPRKAFNLSLARCLQHRDGGGVNLQHQKLDLRLVGGSFNHGASRVVWHVGSFWTSDSKKRGSSGKMNHLGRRVDGESMRGEARPWRNDGCQFEGHRPLPIRCFGEQHHHQVFHRDDADLQLHQFSICELWDIGFGVSRMNSFLQAAGSRINLVVAAHNWASAPV